MIWMTTIVKHGPSEFYIKHAAYRCDGSCMWETARYWRNQNRLWTKDVSEATGYVTEIGAGRAEKIASKYL